MAEQKIDLRKVRDFGAGINDAMVFIRQNAAPLLQSFFAICGIFMLAQAIYGGIFQVRFFELFSQALNGKNQDIRALWRMMGPKYLVLILLAVSTLVAIQVTLGAYLKYYLETKEQPGILDVWSLFRKYYLKICLYSIPVFLSIFAGSCFCLLPGIYLAIVLMPFILVVMIEEKSFSAAYKRCFDLIADNFWQSLVIYLVAYLIYYIGVIFTGIVVVATGGLITYLTTKEISTSIGVASSFLSIFSFSFYLIYFICVAMNYFSLVEKKDGTGLINRINNIGSNPSTWKDTGDQY